MVDEDVEGGETGGETGGDQEGSCSPRLSEE
jgi:hypothetical protein